MLREEENKSWKQHLTKLQLFSHLQPITKTIQIRGTSHAGHSWRSNYELISDVLFWIPSHGRAKVGQPARTYLQHLFADIGFSLEDLLRTMDDRDEWWSGKSVLAAQHDDDDESVITHLPKFSNHTVNYLFKISTSEYEKAIYKKFLWCWWTY